MIRYFGGVLKFPYNEKRSKRSWHGVF